jgi:hypothetical protein
MKDAIEDIHNLRVWDKRMVAFGLADRPDLYSKLCDVERTDKSTVNRLCEAAAVAGGSKIKADLGTLIHKVLELSWFDESYKPPEQFVTLVGAVHDQLRRCGLEPVPDSAERFVINEEHQVAGTFDLLVTDGTEQFVADIKTGSVDYSSIGFACQLACYANADWFYDGYARTPIWEVSKSTGVIIHANPDTNRCELYWLDLEVGSQALELAVEVREMRKQKALTKIEPVAATRAQQLATQAATTAGHGDPWRTWITDRVRELITAGHGQLIRDMWPEDTPMLKEDMPYTDDQVASIERLVANVERSAQALFPPELTVQTPVQDAVQVGRKLRRETPDDTMTVDDKQVFQLRVQINDLADEEYQWLSTIVAACKDANYPIGLGGPGGKASARRHAIGMALLVFAPYVDTPALQAAVLEARNEQHSDTPIGELVGSMTLSEAHHTISVADELGTGAAHLVYTETGCAIVRPLSTQDNEDNL